MKFLILACGAFSVLAAGVAYRFSYRRTRDSSPNDQVSSNWLATAKIHEDHE